jgi:molybdopterin adenylyltransferase
MSEHGPTDAGHLPEVAEVAGRATRSALVLTASDGSAAGVHEDESGSAVAERLAALGFAVERLVVPDDQAQIEAALREAARHHALIVTTGGTGLTPRDVTPQATLAVIDYAVPGMAEAMRAEGRRHTPMADLSRAVVGVRGRTLIVNLPGSPRGAIESFEAIVAVLDHALETLAGPFDHDGAPEASRPTKGATPAAVEPAQGLPEPTAPAKGDPRVVAEPDEHE